MDDSAKKLWERPWTTEEIRQNSGNWTLAGDAGVLQHLQSLSQKLLSKTHEVQKDVDSLVRESNHVSSEIGSAVNDFLMLANIQFVENRVYDEEVHEEIITKNKQDEQLQKSKETREQELLPMINRALALGLSVIEDAFEKHELVASESEDEDGSPSYHTLPILEPKDPYIHRALPHIIGTDKFMSDDFIGLGDELDEEDEDEDEEDDEESDHESYSESEKSVDIKDTHSADETGSVSLSENSFQSSRQKSASVAKSDRWNQEESGESENEDLFGNRPNARDESDSETDEEADTQKNSHQRPLDFASELAAKLHREQQQSRVSRKRSCSGSESSPSRSSQQNLSSEASEKSEPVVNQAADDEEDEDSPFTKKSGLFTRSGGLFDDLNEEEGDLFSDAKRPKSVRVTTKNKKEERSRAQSNRASVAGDLFGGSSSQSLQSSIKDDNNSTLRERKGSAIKTREPQPEKSSSSKDSSKGLFDLSDDDDDSDLFSALASKTKGMAAVKAKKASASSSLFEDEASSSPLPEKEKTSKESTPKKKILAGAVPMIGPAAKPLMSSLRSLSIPNDTENGDGNEADWSDSEKTKAESRSANSRSADSRSADSRSASSLKTESKKVSRSNSGSSNSTSLFADDVDADTLFAPTSTKDEKDAKSGSKLKPKVNNIFGDSDEEEEDDLFSIAKKSSKNSQQQKPTKSKTVAVDGLFSSEESSKTKDSKPPPSSEKLVEEKEKPKAQTETKSNKPSLKKVSLFDDDESEGELFSPSSKSASQEQTPAKLPAKLRSRSLFEDEDVLFGGPEEEAPSVDLFKNEKETVNANDTSNKTRSESAALKKEDLFADSEEESLFAPKTKDAKSGGRKPPIPTPRKSSVDKAANQSDELSSKEVAAAAKEETTVDAPSPKKKPIGGVSMFGGIDPLAVKLKKSGSRSEIGESSKADVSKSPKVEPNVSIKPRIPVTPPRSPRASVNNVKEVESRANFDEPVSAHPLPNASKDRAKISVKRRPPTRKGRQEALRTSGIFQDADVDVPDSGSTLKVKDDDDDDDSKLLSKLSQPSSPLSPDDDDSSKAMDGKISDANLVSPSTEEEDMFAIGDHVGLMTHTPKMPSSTKTDAAKKASGSNSGGNSGGGDDIFDSDRQQKVAVIKSTSSSDDLFGSSSLEKTKSNKFSRTTTTTTVNSDSGSSAGKANGPSKEESSSKKKKKMVAGLFDDSQESEDDLFSSKKKTEASKKKDDDDDDDAKTIEKKKSILSKSASTKSTKSTEKCATVNDLFSDEDDLFKPSLKTNATKKLPAKSLFDDTGEDDIFSDIKPSSGTTTTTTKKNSAKTKQSSLFDDSDDDRDLFSGK